MLATIPSRRRPPPHYAAYIICAALSILLILSLTLHFHPNLYAKFKSTPSQSSLTSISLLSDSIDDDVITSTTEDKIDALDIIDEKQQEDDEDQRNVELDDDDEPPLFDQIKISGHFFDHIAGVIRKAREEEDSPAKINFPAAGGDFPATEFGSDDVPAEEAVRKKAMEVRGIEDLLLLKKNSGLREGWGEWFDKKAVFLRKDKMLRANFEALNPLHNPVLQDPDGGGVTGMSKKDRILQRSLMNDLMKAPFPSLVTPMYMSPMLHGNEEANANGCDGMKGGKMYPVDDSDVGKCNPKTYEKAQEHPRQ